MGSSAWFWSAEQRLGLDRGRDSCEKRRTEQRKESCEEKSEELNRGRDVLSCGCSHKVMPSMYLLKVLQC